MGKKKRGAAAEPAGDVPAAPFNNPFGGLGTLKAPSMPEIVEPPVAVAPSSTAPSPVAAYAGKLVVRRERKGHGGKTVTLLQGVAMPPGELADLARELGKALGTGARADGADIVISGDQSARIESWLRERGARNVVQGN
jgi:translation initiation factor 1